jgi:hypothetical protein
MLMTRDVTRILEKSFRDIRKIGCNDEIVVGTGALLPPFAVMRRLIVKPISERGKPGASLAAPAQLSLRDATCAPFAARRRGRRFGAFILADHFLQRPAVDLAQRVARQRVDHPQALGNLVWR